jgi:hypothetical protein
MITDSVTGSIVRTAPRTLCSWVSCCSYPPWPGRATWHAPAQVGRPRLGRKSAEAATSLAKSDQRSGAVPTTKDQGERPRQPRQFGGPGQSAAVQQVSDYAIFRERLNPS